jgi:hypothetical protein
MEFLGTRRLAGYCPVKNVVFWDMPPCGFIINRHLSVVNRLTLFLARVISSTLKMEAKRSSETLVHNKPTLRHIPEDDILHSHRLENLKSYKLFSCWIPVRQVEQDIRGSSTK